MADNGISAALVALDALAHAGRTGQESQESQLRVGIAMRDATWTRHGESMDKMRAAVRADKSRPAPTPKTVAHRRKKSDGEARARVLHQGRDEAAYEAEMDERIKTIGAEIRAANMQRMRDLDRH